MVHAAPPPHYLSWRPIDDDDDGPGIALDMGVLQLSCVGQLTKLANLAPLLADLYPSTADVNCETHNLWDKHLTQHSFPTPNTILVHFQDSHVHAFTMCIDACSIIAF
jgi:hypothetical protein